MYRPPTGSFGLPEKQAANAPPPAPSQPPTSVGARASSSGSSPFGARIPDISPEAALAISGQLQDLVYSVPLGGYITAEDAANPNSAYVKGYYGDPMTGGNPVANQKAASIYGFIGSLPTKAVGTNALNSLNNRMGVTPTQYPSYNEMLSQYGPTTYKGPFTFPGYNPMGQWSNLYN